MARECRPWRWGLPAVLVDVAVAAVVAAVVTIAISVVREPAASRPDALAYALGGMIALLTLARRRWPAGTLLASATVLMAYYWLQYPAIAPGLALAVALYSAAAHGRIRWPIAVILVYTVVGLLVRGLREQEPFLPLLVNTVEQTTLMFAVVLLGTTVCAHRKRAASAAQALAAAEAQREQVAAHRVAEERLRIARELHDVLAHTIVTVTVQAGVAVDVLDDSPAEARTALREIRTASRAAMEELRATIGLLRADDNENNRYRDRPEPLTPAPTLDQLDGLLSAARRPGLHIELKRAGDVHPLPAAVELTAYRIVQESLTNIIRHSGATHATVRVHYRRDKLVVEITDNGSGRPPADTTDTTPGHGIDGMRERAAAVGGTLVAGPQPDGGFGVRATLPVERWT